MLALIGLIPGAITAIQFIIGKVFDAKVAIVQARTGASRDVAIAMVQAAAQEQHETTAKLSILAGNKLLTLLVVGFATPLVIYAWQIIVIDITICGYGHFSFCHDTDPIRGQVAEWANTIIACLFGSTTVLGVGKMYFSRDKSGE